MATHLARPERDAPRGFIDAVTDRRFWRFAPLSASVVGTAFAIQGLWAARWLVDIEGYGSDQLLHELLAMGVGLTLEHDRITLMHILRA
jgi:hypothetical protein